MIHVCIWTSLLTSYRNDRPHSSPYCRSSSPSDIHICYFLKWYIVPPLPNWLKRQKSSDVSGKWKTERSRTGFIPLGCEQESQGSHVVSLVGSSLYVLPSSQNPHSPSFGFWVQCFRTFWPTKWRQSDYKRFCRNVPDWQTSWI